MADMRKKNASDSAQAGHNAENRNTYDKLAKHRERVARLRPIDDCLFEKLAEDKDVCEEMLQVILEDPALKVLSVTPQNSIKNLYGRSVRLDALCETEDKGQCNIEIQKADDDDHFRRVRFHASCITANIADPGAKFKNVPDVCIVYVTKSDILKKGRTVYHARMTDRETGTCIDDGLSCVYVNAAVNDGTEIAELMQCFLQENVSNPMFPNLVRKMAYFKNDEKGVFEMCDIMEEIRKEGREEGREEGRKEGRKEGREEGRGEGIIKSGRKHSFSNTAIIDDLMSEAGYSYDDAVRILSEYDAVL